jgi:heptosyltransferase-2
MLRLDSTPNSPKPASARLVLSRPDRIGDVVISTSCFEPIKRAMPGVEIFFLAQPQMAPLLRGANSPVHFVPLPKHGQATQRMEALAAQLRRLGPQCLIHLQPDQEIEWAAAAAEIPRRIGFRLHGDKWLTDSLPYTKKLGEKHEGYYNFDLLEIIGIHHPPKLQPHLAPEANALDRLATKLPLPLCTHPYAVLHIGAHEGKPRVEPEYFIAAAQWLINEKRCYVVLIGVDKDDAQVHAVLDGLGPAAAWAFNFCGQTDLAEAAWLLRQAVLVFGRDSGPAHLGAAMGAPTVTLMLEPDQVNSARRWTPLGERSWVLEKPLRRRLLETRPGFARRNLRQFTTEEIVAALRYAMEK